MENEDEDITSEAWKDRAQAWVERHFLWLVGGVVAIALVRLGGPRVLRYLGDQAYFAKRYPETFAKTLPDFVAAFYGAKPAQIGGMVKGAAIGIWRKIKLPVGVAIGALGTMFGITAVLNGFWQWITRPVRVAYDAANEQWRGAHPLVRVMIVFAGASLVTYIAVRKR